ncbi:histidine kinase [Actinomadura sp. DC4]|uniref:sensor histidine kinase n=1 Tax=Actinomadura sp. DC4 TaxID=3055069 RepID=UPI0025AEF3B8|nr:histidine kinase [Actinomadura sp. DC4]MDN3358483.1 histidine kinase [Actinomadura sp. DC4]
MATKTLVFAYLGCVLVSKLADGNEHPDFRYGPFVVVCFVLPFWYVSGRARGPWLRWPWLLLLAQCAVTYLGFAVFEDRWVGGVSGLLGGLVLLVVRSPWSWWLFGLLAGAEISVWLVVGLPYQPPVNAAWWVLNAFGNVSMGLFGLTRLASLVERLESTQDVLAGAAVMAQRLATANDVRSTIMRRLEQLGEHVRNALTNGPAAERTELRLAGEAARAAAASARRIVTEMPAPPELGTADGIERVTPALARRIVAAVVVLYGVQYLLNLTAPSAGGATAGVATTAPAVLVAVTMVLLQLRHARFRPGGGLPPGWPWTLGAQAVLSFVAYPVFGVASTGFLAFLGGSILLLIERPIRWVLFGAIMASLPMLTLLNPGDLAGLPFQLQWSVYAASTLGGAGLLVYGLSRFNRTAGELDIARRQLALVAVTSERLRIAQDAHDTLGLGLSTIALKSDLAQTLLDRGDPRAHREMVHMLHLARTVASDAESIVQSAPALDLDAEIATARDVLTTAGVTTTITRTDIPLDATTESELAAVLREAITNILRHSAARECRIELVCGDGQVSLVIDNDGAPPGREAAQGHGLANIAARAARMGGSMSTEAGGHRFVLATYVPSGRGTTA